MHSYTPGNPGHEAEEMTVNEDAAAAARVVEQAEDSAVVEDVQLVGGKGPQVEHGAAWPGDNVAESPGVEENPSRI